jgi:hypothetical protein
VREAGVGHVRRPGYRCLGCAVFNKVGLAVKETACVATHFNLGSVLRVNALKPFHHPLGLDCGDPREPHVVAFSFKPRLVMLNRGVASRVLVGITGCDCPHRLGFGFGSQ